MEFDIIFKKTPMEKTEEEPCKELGNVQLLEWDFMRIIKTHTPPIIEHSHVRIIKSSYKNEKKILKPRQLPSTYFAMICPAETPE